ncbi:MAG: chorismate-binding protein [Fibrobacteria bacterium]
MKTLLIDNYDSFSQILFHYLWEVNGEKPLLIRNDEWTLDQVRAARFDNIVISPGPGHPGIARDFGICSEVIRRFTDRPILGVCLGMQGLGLAAGAPVIQAPEVRHGKLSLIRHDGRDLFAGLPQEFPAVRYHSLVVDAAARLPGLIITATAADDGQIMGLRLSDRPCYGVQFHPESIGTEYGKELLSNFRDLTMRHQAAAAPNPGAAGSAQEAAAAGSTLERLTSATRHFGQVARETADGRANAASPIPVTPGVLDAVELPWADPEAAFARWFKDDPAAFWLDSLSEPVPGEPRMTYMGAGSRLIEARGRGIRILERSGSVFVASAVPVFDGDPLAYLDARLRGATVRRMPEGMVFPGSFLGGLIGWFGYGLKRFTGTGAGAEDTEEGNFPVTLESDLPDALFLEPDRLLAFDAGARKVFAILTCGPDAFAIPSSDARDWLRTVASNWPIAHAASSPEAAHDLGLGLAAPESEGMEVLAAEPLASQGGGPGVDSGGAAFHLPWRLSASKEEYLDRIRSLQAAIRRGETYEACLTNEWRASSGADSFEVYRVLRRINPAPYAAYLRFPQASVLCASPERFLKLDPQGRMACRPIKGTRRRGASPEEDAALRADLAVNAKDRSENLMIVDLVRNDFGKVCRLGSVRAPDLMKVETHPTVLQLVSTVVGLLEPGRSALDAVRACFPGGSMTGAPKLRTMELLEAAEGRARGVFSGALGYLGWDGAMDLGMVIRTLVVKDGEFRIGCGGAILAESDPEAEFAEAMLKAHASRQAVELASFEGFGPWKPRF